VNPVVNMGDTDVPELPGEERKPHEADSREIYEAGKGERRNMQPAVAELPGHQTSLSSSHARPTAPRTADSGTNVGDLPQSGSGRHSEGSHGEIVEAGIDTNERDRFPQNSIENGPAAELVESTEQTTQPRLTETEHTPTHSVDRSPLTQPPPALPPTTENSNLDSTAADQIPEPSGADSQLERLRQEMALIQEERAREERLRALSSRELELMRAIEERERNERRP
jgi:hypothetical protein